VRVLKFSRIQSERSHDAQAASAELHVSLPRRATAQLSASGQFFVFAPLGPERKKVTELRFNVPLDTKQVSEMTSDVDILHSGSH